MTDIYEAWLEAKMALTEAQDNERRLRARIITEELKGTLEGARTVYRGQYKVTSTAVLNRKIDREVLNSIWEELTWEEQQAVDWKPTLKLAEYKPMEATGCKLMEAVETKPGAGQLKIVKVRNNDDELH